MSWPSRKLSSRWPSRSSDTRTVRAPGPAAGGAGSVIPWGLSDTLATRDKVLISQGVAPVLGVIASAAVQGQKPDLRFRSATSHCPRGSHVSSGGSAEPDSPGVSDTGDEHAPERRACPGGRRPPGSNRATSASPAPQFGQQQQALPRSAVVLKRWRFEVPPALAWRHANRAAAHDPRRGDVVTRGETPRRSARLPSGRRKRARTQS